MTLFQEFSSFCIPGEKSTQPPPKPGMRAPSSDLLRLPSLDKRPTVITFLRHCGCPFAEKTFKNLRAIAERMPDIHFIAVSHSDQASTETWLAAVGGSDQVQIIVDVERELFGLWGLQVSTFSHFLSPAGLWAVYRLGNDEGIWNRPTQSGNRWQTSGSFAVDSQGIVRWGGAMKSASEIPDFQDAIEQVKAAEPMTES